VQGHHFRFPFCFLFFGPQVNSEITTSALQERRSTFELLGRALQV